MSNRMDRGLTARPWPLGLDTRDPEQIAGFGLRLGYPADNVVNTLVERCNVDRITARRIVDDAQHPQQGGH